MIKTRLEPGDHGAWGCFFEPDSVVRELSLGSQEPVYDDSISSKVICLLGPPGILNTPMAILEWIKPTLKNSNTEILFQ